MIPDSLVVRYGEITLKGKNRIDFEKQLKRDIERHLKNSGSEYRGISLMRGRIYVHGLSSPADLRSVLGVYSYSPAREIARDYDELKGTVRGLLAEFAGYRSFRISCQRVDKKFSPDSMAVEREIGDIVGRETGIPVSLTDPELNIQIEIGLDHIYVFTEKKRGFSGFPFGSAGKLVSLLSGGIDSPVATFLMMKRGVKPVLIHFEISESTTRKVQAIREKLEEYAAGNRLKLYLIPRDEIFAGRFEELFRSRYQDYLCVMCKYLMHRKACEIARSEKALGIITGDNLAQVASQTLKNLFAQRRIDDLPVYSPLIAFEKQETVRWARDIGTYELSIAAADGCTPPPNPKTRVSAEKLEQILKETGFIG